MPDYSHLSPGMQQYMNIKDQHRDCIVLFRMGDFYETFYEDAKLVAKELEITLTARGKGESRAPLAGLPYHALEPYLAKLVKKGHKVALVEQLEDPKKTKKLVKRGVVRIVTAGTVVESSMLDAGSNNYMLSIASYGGLFGLAAVDLSTGEFIVTETDQLQPEIIRFQPSEILIPESLQVNTELFREYCGLLQGYADINYTVDAATTALLTHFKVVTVNGFGLQGKHVAIRAAGALISYLSETQRTQLPHIHTLSFYSPSTYMALDSSTIRNLELLQNILDGGTKGSLLTTINATSTSMGARLLKKILLQPLVDQNELQNRHNAVEELCKNALLKAELISQFQLFHDLERLIARVSYGNASPRDLIALKTSLQLLPTIHKHLQGSRHLQRNFPPCANVAELIAQSIISDPPAVIRDGNVIASGFNEELDRLRSIMSKGKTWVAELERKEKEKTGIKNLRVGFNSVFGYYFAVSNSNKALVPDYYIRKQTLSNEERYITPELKEQEQSILNAEEKSNTLEQEIYGQIIEQLCNEVKNIQIVAQIIAEIDVYLSFATIAIEHQYVRPIFVRDTSMKIINGRHPVLEKLEEHYIPNDCDFTDSSLHIITGPNMSGKSSFMRQVALIQLLAQIGSFVPAESASLSVCDRIFTRVGAYDDLSHGQSTFMVEMVEAANILHHATEKSLVVLDEIGRGTSTYDGIALAWAIAEYLHERKAKTLFATHYHQLNALAEQLSQVKNYNVVVHEEGDTIVFLHTLQEGGTDKSYGIQVAKLAGVPDAVVERSKVIMSRLELESTIAERVHAELPMKKKNDNIAERNVGSKNTGQLRLDEV